MILKRSAKRQSAWGLVGEQKADVEKGAATVRQGRGVSGPMERTAAALKAPPAQVTALVGQSQHSVL